MRGTRSRARRASSRAFSLGSAKRPDARVSVVSVRVSVPSAPRGETPGGDANSAARYAPRSKRETRSGSSPSSDPVAGVPVPSRGGSRPASSAALTSAIAEIPRSCRSAQSGRSRRKHSASRANVAIETCLVKSGRRPNGAGGAGGARRSVAGDHAKAFSAFSARAVSAFAARTHSLVASASAASCSPREYRWKKPSKPSRPSEPSRAQPHASSRSAYDVPEGASTPAPETAVRATSRSVRSTSAGSAATAEGRSSQSAEKVTPLGRAASWWTTSRRHRRSNGSASSQARSRVRDTRNLAVPRAHANAPTGNEDGSG